MNFKLKYKLVEVQGKLYQEKNPGELIPWSLSMAKSKYGPNINSQIEHFIDFTCEPSHIKYKRIINNEYNRYHKLKHKPKKGEWNIIENFLKHIFSTNDIQMPLEYFWNLYINPKQKLPFLGLVSEKKGTGKSTFMNFLALIFGKNVSVVSPYDFKSQFNDHYGNALIITSDEHSEGKDRKLISEKLKMLITEERIRIEGKHRTAYTTINYIKIVFAGNNEEMLTVIDPENTRYWIVKVCPIKNLDLDILTKLEKEIPAFLFFLKNEFKPRPKRNRLYFNPIEFQTNAVKLIQYNSKPELQKKIENYIKSLFESFKEVNEIYYIPKDLGADIQISDTKAISNTLKNCFNLHPSKDSKYHKIGCRDLQHLLEIEKKGHYLNAQKTNRTGRYYTFLREKFISC